MKQVWVCSACTYENRGNKMVCEMCDNSKRQSIKQSKLEKSLKNHQNGNKIVSCDACSSINQNQAEICQICGYNLKASSKFDLEGPSQRLQEKNIENIQTKMIKCNACQMINDGKNKVCVFCDQNLIEISAQKLSFENQNKCRFCKMEISKSLLKAHQVDCQSSQKLLENEESNKNKITCPYCWNKYTQRIIRKHTKKCEEKENIFRDKKRFGRLTPLQLQTIKYMHEKCQCLHFDSIEKLKKRIRLFKYDEQDLDNLHHYIANYAPIIIHINAVNNMKHYLSDTHYRNIFEVTKQNDTSRVEWEDRMFDTMHSHASFYERVKYGTINFTNDPNGVRACFGYGSSHLLLKEAVRDRCTFTDMDSAAQNATIGTLRFCFHVLMKLTDKQLKCAFQGSKAIQVSSIGVIDMYKEIQIHGPIEFKQDIERVYLNKVELQYGYKGQIQKAVKEFAEKNQIQYEMFESEKKKQQKQLDGLFDKNSKKKANIWKKHKKI